MPPRPFSVTAVGTPDPRRKRYHHSSSHGIPSPQPGSSLSRVTSLRAVYRSGEGVLIGRRVCLILYSVVCTG